MATLSGFVWNEENTAEAIAAYENLVATDGLESANSNESLDLIAGAVGAKNAASVRRKLAASGKYQKIEKAPATPRAVAAENAHAWTEERTAEMLALYKADVEALGASDANDRDNLQRIASLVGALNGRSVSSKLASMKEYVKAESPRRVAGGGKPRKVSLLRELAATMAEKSGEDKETILGKIEGAEHATVDSLMALKSFITEYC